MAVLTNRTAAAAFAGWREAATERAAMRQTLATCLARLQQRTVAAAWCRWREFVEEQQRTRERLAAVVQHWQGAVLAKALRVSALVHVVGHCESCVQCCLPCLPPTAGAACVDHLAPFTPQAWREGAAHQKLRIAQLMAAAQRWHQPLLAEAFSEWLDQARAQRLLAAQLQTAVAHWMNASLATAFNTWRYQVCGR